MLPQHPDRSYTEPHPQKGTSESGDGAPEEGSAPQGEPVADD